VSTATGTVRSTMTDPWRRILVKTGAVYLFSRVCVLVGAAIVAAELRADVNKVEDVVPLAPFADPHYIDQPISDTAVRPILDVLTSWDGLWYLRVVRDGYPTSIPPNVTYDMPEARAAFFPAYPMLVRTLDWVIPGGDVFAALVVNFLLGAVAVWLIGLLAREVFDDAVAERTMILACIFPGAFVLSFAYTEALLLAVAAGCLLCLLRHQWLAAGILAAVGTASRPNGIALVLACVVAAVVAIHERREWRALAAPALAPMGFIGFMVFLDRHTGESGAWFRVQREAWSEGVSFGLTAFRNTWEALTSPLSSPTDTITAVSLVTLAALLYFLWKRRLPLPLVAFVVGILGLMLLPSTVTARPRFLYTAFPLLISAAAWFDAKRAEWWPWVVASCCVGLTALTALYGVLGAIP
jgi:Dolichyl-phosphate-mannose-protein mannosyltransferase